VLVKGQSMKIKMGVEQRDSAIKAGAEAPTTIIVSGGQLVVPPDYDLDKERPESPKRLDDFWRSAREMSSFIGHRQDL